jgi:chromate transporter
MEVATRAEIALPSIVDLFAGFFIVGVYGFGGALPWARRMIVEQRKWLVG